MSYDASASVQTTPNQLPSFSRTCTKRFCASIRTPHIFESIVLELAEALELVEDDEVVQSALTEARRRMSADGLKSLFR
jgi:hypothetical protein